MFYVWVVHKGQEPVGKQRVPHSPSYPEWQVVLEYTNLLCDLGVSLLPILAPNEGVGRVVL